MIALDTAIQQEAAMLITLKDKLALVNGGVSTKITFKEMVVVDSSDPAKILKQVQEAGDSVALIRSSEGRRMYMLLPDGAVLFKGAALTDMHTDDLILDVGAEILRDRGREASSGRWDIADTPVARLAYLPPKEIASGAAYYLFQDLCVPYVNPQLLDSPDPVLLYLPPIIAGGKIALDKDRVVADFFLAATEMGPDVGNLPLYCIGLPNTYLDGSVCFGSTEVVRTLGEHESASPFSQVRTSLFQFLGGKGNLDLISNLWRSSLSDVMRSSVGATMSESSVEACKKYITMLKEPYGWKRVKYPVMSKYGTFKQFLS